MSEEWFYVINGERHGPVALPDLVRLVREGRLTQADLVWHPDFGPQWKPARDVAQLMIAFSAADVCPSVQATTPDGQLLAPVEQGASVGSELQNGDDPSVPLWGERGQSPSAWRSVRAAWRWMKAVLFKPFSLGLWFSIGFCAWISSFQAGNPFGNLVNSFLQEEAKSEKVDWALVQRHLVEKLSQLYAFLQTPKGMIVAATSIGIFLLVSLLFLYFKGRGLLMFQHRLYVPRTSISDAWRRSKQGGASLFRWLLGYQVAVWLTLAAVGYGAWVSFLSDLFQKQWVLEEAHLLPLMVTLSVLSIAGLTFALALRITESWIVPVVYCRGVTASAAWRSAWSLMGQHPFGVIGYFIVQDLCNLLWGLFYFFLVLGTCCVAAFPLMIPFVQIVAILPVLFFNRGYSTIYLSQWRPELVTPVEEEKGM